MTRAVVRAFVVAIVIAGGTGATAQTLPALNKPVNDFAGVIDRDSANELDRRIRALEKATPTHDAVVVATVESIAPYGSIEDYALNLFERAGIGQKGQNNGLLVVMSKGDRQVRIEVGYDLEEFITDGYAGDLIRQVMLPAFRRGEFGPGILEGTTRIINRIADRRGVKLTDVPASEVAGRDDDPSFWVKALPIIIVIVFVIIGMIRRSGPSSRYRGPRGPFGGIGPFLGGMGGFGGGGFGGGGFGGGGGGGGFGGFGGGMSGGGGASGRW